MSTSSINVCRQHSFQNESCQHFFQQVEYLQLSIWQFVINHLKILDAWSIENLNWLVCHSCLFLVSTFFGFYNSLLTNQSNGNFQIWNFWFQSQHNEQPDFGQKLTFQNVINTFYSFMYYNAWCVSSPLLNSFHLIIYNWIINTIKKLSW